MIYIYRERSIWPVMYNLHKLHLSGRNVGKLSTITVNHDVRVALNSCGFSIKNDSWKSGVIYFMRICDAGVLLVSNISYDLIRACSDDSHEYA